MKRFVLLGSIAVVCAATAFAVQTGSAQTSTEAIKVSGCLQGDGSDQNPWILAGAVLPPPPGAAPAAAPGGGRGAGAPAGAGRGDGAGRGGGAPAGAGRGDGAGRGGGAPGGRGGAGAPAAAVPVAPPPPPVNLRLTGVNMSPWRRMYIEVHGTLGARGAGGPQEFRVTSARSAQGDCR